MTPTILSPEARGWERRPDSRIVSIAHKRTFSQPLAAGEQVFLRHDGGEGHFWVTFEGLKTDFTLSPGQSLRFSGPGLLVAEALEAAARLRID